MYAIVTISGKQFRVKQGDVLSVDRLVVDKEPAEKGYETDVQAVHFIGGEGIEQLVGAPTVAGASVRIKVLGEEKGKKVIAFKKVNRNGYHKKQGHRQLYSKIEVLGIQTA
jgi:large subunit ribosomal protein L21